MTLLAVALAGNHRAMTSWLSSDTVLLGADCPLPLEAPFTAAVAALAGVSPRTLRTLSARGLIRRVGQGVYAVAQAPNTIEFRAASLRLVLPPSAVLTDRTAAWLHGIDLLPRSKQSLMPRLSVFQRPGTRSRRPGLDAGERALAKRDVMVIEGLTVTTPLRTACDLGRLLWRFDAFAALDQFLRLGVPQDVLLAEIERFKGYRGVVQLRAFAPLADPRAESVPESWLRLHWYDAGLPKPEPQWWVDDDFGVPMYRLDVALPEALFGAEYDGDEFHSGPEAKAADEGRRTWLDEERHWHLEIFDKRDHLGSREADPAPRLRKGLVIARRRLSLPRAYPSLQ